MATVTTSASVAAGATWVLLHTAGATNLVVQNRSTSLPMLIRIGASTATSDDDDSAAEVLQPGERVTLSLTSGDKVHARVAVTPGSVSAQPALAVLRTW